MTDAQFDAAFALLTAIQNDVADIRRELARMSATLDRIVLMCTSRGRLNDA